MAKKHVIYYDQWQAGRGGYFLCETEDCPGDFGGTPRVGDATKYEGKRAANAAITRCMNGFSVAQPREAFFAFEVTA